MWEKVCVQVALQQYDWYTANILDNMNNCNCYVKLSKHFDKYFQILYFSLALISLELEILKFSITIYSSSKVWIQLLSRGCRKIKEFGSDNE